MFEKLKNFCDSFLDYKVPGFDLVVYKDGECVLRYMKGYSDLENKIPMTGKEKYNIYSCSKFITCVAAMQLWEKGLFSLEDKLSRYMPEFSEMTVKTESGTKKAENKILVKHLFEMTAGFSYACTRPFLQKAKEATDGKCPTRQVIKHLAEEPLLFEPGERWEYSLCHDVLAAFVEVVSGEKFEDYVKKNIFDVAGMNDSTFNLPLEELDSVSPQYKYVDGEAVNIGKQIYIYKFGSEYASGGAGCVSTTDDCIKFLEAVRTFKLLKPETVRLMTTDRLNDAQRATCWVAKGYGYGLGLRCSKGNKLQNDFGWGGAAGAYQAVDIENGITIYLSTHIIGSPAQGVRNMLSRFVRAQLIDNGGYDEIYNELETLFDYKWTY